MEAIDESNVIYYGIGKSPMPLVSARDMVALTRKTIKDGIHIVVCIIYVYLAKSVVLP